MRFRIVAIFGISLGALCCGALHGEPDTSAAASAPSAGSAAAAPAALSSPLLESFYIGLSPYGTWTETGDLGWIWAPAPTMLSTPPENAAEDWQPYTVGHWAISSYGWTWMSDEPFGWATYHYGRWFKLDEHGWAWVPGTDFAPAWVDWRSGNGYVGWAPLPPAGFAAPPADEYSFVKAGALLAPRLAGALQPPADASAVFERTSSIGAPPLAGEHAAGPSRFSLLLPRIVDVLDALSDIFGAMPTSSHTTRVSTPPQAQPKPAPVHATATPAPAPPPPTAHSTAAAPQEKPATSHPR